MAVKAIRLAFAEFNSQNVERLKQYYLEVMGYRLVEEGADGAVYLSNGVDHHNIVIRPSDRNGLTTMGFELDGKQGLEEVQKELNELGYPSEIKKNKPGIDEYLELHDPAGNIVQLFNDMQQPAVGYGTTGIVPIKLGHIAFYAQNYEETIQFYQHIGFDLTDKIRERFANFMTCNFDHHVLNIIASDETEMHHIAFQLKDASHQYRSSDILAKHNIATLWGPSRHTAGHNIATYHFDPDENVVELFIDMDVYIPEKGIMEPRPWHEELPLKPRVWDSLSAWWTEFDFDLANVRELKSKR